MCPFSRSSSTTRLTVAAGTVTARPWAKPRVLMPTTSPLALTSGPPENPGYWATTTEQHFDVFVTLHAVMNRYDHTLLPFDATGRHPASGMDGNHATAHLLRGRRKFA